VTLGFANKLITMMNDAIRQQREKVKKQQAAKT
jgi:hypothetical protein